MNIDFHKNSLLEGYKRIQLEAIVVVCISLAFTVGVMLWSWKVYKERTRETYIHANGVTLQILDSKKINKNE